MMRDVAEKPPKRQRGQPSQEVAQRPPDAGHGPPAAWRKSLVPSADAPTGNEFNAAVLLRQHPALEGRISYDEFRQCPMCYQLPWSNDDSEARPWDDRDDIAAAAFAQRLGLSCKPGVMANAVRLVAHERRHHPVRTYFGQLLWDGVERLSEWPMTYLGVKTKTDAGRSYVAAAGRAWMISAVARIFRPGCKADLMLVLEGAQGGFKSSAVAALAPVPSWYTDQISEFGTKDAAQDLPGKMLIEVSELDAMGRAAVSRVKAFVSRATDHYRPSYGRRAVDVPRQSVFAGTVNEDAYLRDDTGNRRFLPLRCGQIDLDSIRRDRDQLWAEAVYAFHAGEQWWLAPEVDALAREQQAARKIQDPWQSDVLKWADGHDYVRVPMVLGWLDIPKERRTQTQQNRVAAILKGAGYVRVQVRDGEQREWVYRQPSEDQEAGAVTSQE